MIKKKRIHCRNKIQIVFFINLFAANTVGKVGAAAGKPAFVITNKQGQPIRTNQQIIFVTTASGIRTVQTGSIVTSSTNNFVSLVSSPQVNTITSAMASGTNSVQTAPGTVKMIRGVGQQGKPITFTLPVSNLQGNKTGSPQLISMPQKGLTIGGKAVTVQLAPGNQKTVTIVSSASGGGIQKTINAADLQAGGHKIVMMPSKRVANVITTHKAIPMSAAQINDPGNDQGDNSLITEGSHLEVLDQLDGAFDIINDSDENNDDADCEHIDRIKIQNRRNSSSSNSMKSQRKKQQNNRKLSIASESGVHKQYQQSMDRRRSLQKIVPKYVKMGLFGGSPYGGADPVEQPESTTEQESDSANNEANTNVDDQAMGDGHVDTSVTDVDGNIVQQSSNDDGQSNADDQKNDGVSTSGMS